MVRVLVALLSIVVAACEGSPQAAVGSPPPTGQTTPDALFSLGGSKQDFDTCITVLQRANVVSDIAEAKRRGDRRLIAIMGFAFEVPGVPAFAQGTPPSDYTPVPIRGTSDLIESETQFRCQSMLYAFAERYNRGLVEGGEVPPNDELQRTRPAQATEPRR
jgi:hypothetical protein